MNYQTVYQGIDMMKYIYKSLGLARLQWVPNVNHWALTRQYNLLHLILEFKVALITFQLEQDVEVVVLELE